MPRPKVSAPTTTEEVLHAVSRVLKRGQADAEPELHRLVLGMAAYGHQRSDPIRSTFTRLGDKWSMLLLLVLRTGCYHHGQLRRLVDVIAAEKGISQRMLTLRLRELERDGFIRRTVLPEVPPRVEYMLTPLGRELADRASALIDWIGENSDRIREARAAFQVRTQSS